MPLPLTYKYTTTPTVTSMYFSQQNSFISLFFYLHFFATKISVKSTFDILLQLAVSVSPYFFIRSFFASSFESELHGIVFNIQQMSLLSSTLTQCRHSKVSYTPWDVIYPLLLLQGNTVYEHKETKWWSPLGFSGREQNSWLHQLSCSVVQVLNHLSSLRPLNYPHDVWLLLCSCDKMFC